MIVLRMNEMSDMIDDGYTRAGQSEGAARNKITNVSPGVLAPNLNSRVWLWEWNSSHGLTH